MDALRSCYRTTMRFPGVGVVPVVWYWTDKKPLPFDTVYGSHNHSREDGWEDGDTGEPGEVWGAARPYYDGSPLIDVCCTGPQGSADAWAGISDSNSPLYLVPKCEARGIGVKWRRRRRWLTTVIPGPVLDALAEHSRSFSASFSGFSRYYTTFSNERKFQVAFRTDADYNADWRQDRRWIGPASIGMYYTADWRDERAWGATVAAAVLYAPAWARERGFAAAVSAAFAAAVAWRQDRSLSGSARYSSMLSPAWNEERGLTATVSYSANFAAAWNRRRSLTASDVRVENVLAFNCGALVATGSTQGTAAAIATDTVFVTSTGVGQGVILPAGCYRVVVKNGNSVGGNNINVYPPAGATIVASAVNIPAVLTPGTSVMYVEETATHWAAIAMAG